MLDESDSSYAYERIAITAFGHDRPGILSSFAELLADNSVEILDIGLSTVRDRFALTILAEVSTATQASKLLAQKIKSLSKIMGFDVRVEFSTSLLAQARQGNVVLVVYGGGGTSHVHITRAIAGIFRVVAANDGDIAGLSLETNQERHDVYLTIGVDIPSYRLDFAELRQQLRDVQDMNLKVAVMHEAVFRSMQRIDIEGI